MSSGPIVGSPLFLHVHLADVRTWRWSRAFGPPKLMSASKDGSLPQPTRVLVPQTRLECRLRLLLRELPRFLGTPSSRPRTVRFARTNEDLTRHGDEPPAMAAAHRAAGKRRRCRDLVAAVAAMVGRPCSPRSRAHTSRVADRTPRTPTPSPSSPAATRNRSSSRPTVFLITVPLPLRLPQGERRARAGAGTRGRTSQHSWVAITRPAAHPLGTRPGRHQTRW